VRIYETLRSAHLERAHELADCTIYYRTRRSDFDPSLAQGLDLIRTGTAGMVLSLLFSDVRAIEVNEPLMRPGIVRSALAVAALRLRAAVTRTPLRVCSYAIENLAPAPTPSLRGRWRYARDRRLGRWLFRRLDRIAFGTSAARRLYGETYGPVTDTERRNTALIPAIPHPCPCPSTEPPVDRIPDTVVFLGALTERKGVPLLLSAWPQVAREQPGARLVVIGSGPLLSAVQAVAADNPGVDVHVDPPRAEIHRILRTATVLVLPSQRRPHWREQVGLPLVEALAHGVRVVTTDETGLADWLRSHGHRVLPAATDPAALAEAIGLSLRGGPDPAAVLADLPSTDGRLAADEWLFAG
jgi:glycosyltransferase involved in cell wall biosynthesis